MGLAAGPQAWHWAAADEEAGVGLFRCLADLGVDPGTVRAFAFAASPGSVLGIRTAAVAIRTWCALAPRPVFAYQALELVAAACPRPEAAYIADARRGAWHHLRPGEPLRRVASADLAGPLVTPGGFRHWTALPAGVETVPYDLAELLPRAADRDLFRGHRRSRRLPPRGAQLRRLDSADPPRAVSKPPAPTRAAAGPRSTWRRSSATCA